MEMASQSRANEGRSSSWPGVDRGCGNSHVRCRPGHLVHHADTCAMFTNTHAILQAAYLTCASTGRWSCRYVGYFWAVLCSGPGPAGLLPEPRSVQLRQVTISGLPPGTADSCVLLVEARPSGSLAPHASRVCARSAPRALSGSLTGETEHSGIAARHGHSALVASWI